MRSTEVKGVRHRGVALGAVLVCLSAVVAVLFLAVSASLSHLNLVNRLSQRDHAVNLAESALSRAIEQFILSNYDKNFAANVTVTHSEFSDAEGTVSFDQGLFSEHYSTNNIDSDSSIQGSGGVIVPPRSIHLVARGRVGTVERWMECIFYKPPFPDGLVANGPVEASGLILTGVKTSGSYQGGNPTGVEPEEQAMANLFSNASTGPAGKAVTLGAGCEINGSVGARGQIDLDPGTQIRGEVLPGSEERPLPKIKIADRINTLKTNARDVVYSGGDLNLDENWFNHVQGGVNVSGDLNLNGSALTVNGDLTVQGAIKGTGVILVDGSVTLLDGGTTVATTDQVALAATGDVTLSAGDMEGNYFQGLVYTEGNFKADNITVVGAVTVPGDQNKGIPGSVELENVRFVRSPASVDITLRSVQGHKLKGGDRNGAVSYTLFPAPDGKSYICTARAFFSLNSDVKTSELDDMTIWEDKGDHFVVKEWPNRNIGVPGPDFGKALALEIASWGADVDSGYEQSVEDEFKVIIKNELDSLVQQTQSQYNLTFSLNNLLADQNDKSRILLWRPVGVE